MKRTFATQPDQGVPLCVDLDGTLVATDTLIELVLELLKNRPWLVFALPVWLLRGKAYFKGQVVQGATVSAAHLPYRPEVVAYLESARKAGRPLVLATASPFAVARAVADHLGIFDRIVATKGVSNMSGHTKAQALVTLFGEQKFDYMGNSLTDLAVWPHARRALVVTSRNALVQRVASTARLDKVFLHQAAGWHDWLRLLRHYQWAKNILVFIPLVAAHRLTDSALITQSLLALVAFCAASSSVYVLNDALDLQADRLHPRKRHRPLAAGRISLLAGLAVVPLLLIASGAVSWLLPVRFQGLLVMYLLLTWAYSFYFKRLIVVDVILLALLYTLRIFSGAAAIAVPVSTWLTAFALFFFLSLALVKRFAELKRLKSEEKIHATGRGYHVGDISWLSQLGTASAYLSVLVLALYISSDEVLSLYRTPFILWALVPLSVYWVSRLWLLAHRGATEEDPLIFAMRDRVSYFVLLLFLAVVLLAT